MITEGKNGEIISGVTCPEMLPQKEKTAEEICSRRYVELSRLWLNYKKGRTSEWGMLSHKHP
ncbi:MAG: hypothetical protein ABSG75_06880 [Syntrophales bacterium]